MTEYRELRNKYRVYHKDARDDMNLLWGEVSKIFDLMIEKGYEPETVAYEICNQATSCVAHFNIKTGMELRKKEFDKEKSDSH